MMVANGLDLVPAFTRADRLFFDLHTAPGGDDDVGIALDDLFGLDDAVLGLASLAELRKDWLAAGDLDEFLDPLDATDDWIVPLFEEDARPARKAGRRFGGLLQLRLICRDELIPVFLTIDEPRD